MSLADTNNNPGNIRDGSYAQGQPGYTGSNKGFATFQTAVDGFNAQVALLRSYYDKGVNTISKVITKYAPPSENNTGAYIKSVSDALHIDPNQTLSPQNLKDLAAAMAHHEGFGDWKNLLGGNPASASSAPASSVGGVVSSVTDALTPNWLRDLLNGHTAARWVSVLIGIILIGLAIAAFTLTSDTGKQVIAAVK